MDDGTRDDHFRRIELHHEIEKERLKIAQYETGLAHFRQKVEERQYRIGRLDERLGS